MSFEIDFSFLVNGRSRSFKKAFDLHFKLPPHSHFTPQAP